MLKGVKKGLKKKIKGKKQGKDEDDIFDPESLEKLKRELEQKRKAQAIEEGESSQNGSQSAASVPPQEDEEWAKFKLLTAGVDNVLKKSSEGLGKIKETSFFQHQITDPTNLWRHDKGAVVEEVQVPESKVETPPEEQVPEEPTVAPEDIEPVELDDSLFDTTYLDAIASGEIHLAYIPDSPTEEEGDDPFDTSGVADVVKRIEEAEKREKRQVNLGSAVDFLSGKAGLGTGGDADNSRARPRAGAGGRARPRAVNLLGDFDNPENSPKAPIFEDIKEDKKDILDDILDSSTNDSLPLPELETIVASPASTPSVNVVSESPKQDHGIQDILGEFDLIGGKEEGHRAVTGGNADYLRSILEPEEDLDDEFAALAAESVAKSPLPTKEEEPEEDDPFDTTFVEKVVVEEKEPEPEPTPEPVERDDFDFDPRAEEPDRLSPPQSLLEDHTSIVDNLPALEPQFRAKAPTGNLVDHADSRVVAEKEVDPFDTTIVKVVLPGRAELKLLEEELLNAEVVPLKAKITQLPAKFSAPAKQISEEEDFNFDPRADEKKSDHPFDQEGDHQPDPSEHGILVPQQEEEAELDPFDTSCVAGLNLGPGQLELKLLESELVSGGGVGESSGEERNAGGTSGLEQLDDDFDFDPRGGEEPDPFVVVVNQGTLRTEDIFGDHHEDLFGADKPLIPQQEGVSPIQPIQAKGIQYDEGEDPFDPFDTSAIEIIKLAPSELKAIEGEILSAPHFSASAPQIKLKAAFSAPAVPLEFSELKPQLTLDEEAAENPHLLEAEDPFHIEIEHKPLTPLEPSIEFDPFDTSIAEGVVPGLTEIRILEQELQLGIDGLSGRRLSDPDFDPRGATVVKPQPIHPATLSYVSKTLEPTRIGSLAVDEDDVDPFDTSAVDSTFNSIGGTGSIQAVNENQPDLKALEAELL